MYILFIRVQKLVMFYCKFKVKQVSAVFITRLMKIQRDHKTIYDLVSRPTVERKADAALLRFVFAFSAEPIYLITYNDAMRLRCTFRFRRQQRMHATSPTLYVWCESVQCILKRDRLRNTSGIDNMVTVDFDCSKNNRAINARVNFLACLFRNITHVHICTTLR